MALLSLALVIYFCYLLRPLPKNKKNPGGSRSVVSPAGVDFGERRENENVGSQSAALGEDGVMPA